MPDIEHKDIPDSERHEVKGASTASAGQVYTSNGDGTAGFATSPSLILRTGWWDYNDAATASTPISLASAGTYYQLTNDGLGVNTNTSFGLDSVGDLFDTSTNTFDFSSLNIGDLLMYRVDVDLTSSGANHEFSMRLNLAVGSGSDFSLIMDEKNIKSAGTKKWLVFFPAYIGSDVVRDYPATISISSDGTGDSVKVNGWFARVDVLS